MSAATCDDANSWQRDANIRLTDTLTELGLRLRLVMLLLLLVL